MAGHLDEPVTTNYSERITVDVVDVFVVKVSELKAVVVQVFEIRIIQETTTKRILVVTVRVLLQVPKDCFLVRQVVNDKLIVDEHVVLLLRGNFDVVYHAKLIDMRLILKRV